MKEPRYTAVLYFPMPESSEKYILIAVDTSNICPDHTLLMVFHLTGGKVQCFTQL